MKSLISQLKKHSLYDFPVKDVSSSILNSVAQEDIIKKHSHFSKSMYTRNRIFRNDDFEIILIMLAAESNGSHTWARGRKMLV